MDGHTYSLKQIGQLGMPNPQTILINMSAYPEVGHPDPSPTHHEYDTHNSIGAGCLAVHECCSGSHQVCWSQPQSPGGETYHQDTHPKVSQPL